LFGFKTYPTDKDVKLAISNGLVRDPEAPSVNR